MRALPRHLYLKPTELEILLKNDQKAIVDIPIKQIFTFACLISTFSHPNGGQHFCYLHRNKDQLILETQIS